MTSSLTTPVEIDTEIAERTMPVVTAEQRIARQVNYRESSDRYLAHRFDQDELDAAKAEYDKAVEALREVEALYTGWPRYFHVTNSNGHIHTSMSCSSCFPETQYAWRTDLSGLTDEEVVEREAYNACTVCMPIAPAEQKAAREYYNRQQREARAAEKDAKKNEKLRRQAERAVKFLAKVDKVVEQTFGSWDTLREEYSLYGHDGRKNYYQASYDLPTQVADYIYDEMAILDQERGQGRASSRHMKDPKAIIAEAREQGLIAPEG